MKRRTGFYIFLFLCMAGLGVTAFYINRDSIQTQSEKTATSSVSIESEPNFYTTSSKDEYEIESVPQSSDVESSEQSTEQTSEVATAAKADFFVYPMSGEIVTDFTNDTLIYSKTYDDWRTHLGIDIKGSFGESVHAAGDGVAEEVYYDEFLGNTIVIDHGNGIKIYYCGLDEIVLKAGQTVSANDTIASLGEIPCENLDGVHLHMAVKKDGEYINPMDIIS